MTIEDTLGFSQIPFSREFKISNRISFDFIEQQTQKIKETVENRASALLIAPAGCGKTVILRNLKAQLAETRYKVSYVKVTGLSERDMCKELCASMGLPIANTYPKMLRNIQAYIEQISVDQHQRPVVLIDEAHDMRPKSLSMLRLLTNFEMDSKLRISLVLVGQPQLKEKLYQAGLEDIRQRLAHCAELRLLTREETLEYLKHRVSIAGKRTFCFDSHAIEALYEYTHGNMRALDALAYKALGHAAANNDQIVNQQHCENARNELWL